MQNWRQKISPTKIYFLFVIVATIIWIAFKPNFIATIDENNYWQNGWLIEQGQSLTKSSANELTAGFKNSAGLYVSKYNLGNSIWLVPFNITNQIDFVLWAGLVSYLLFCLLVYLTAKELKINPLWAIPIILAPQIIYFSRTLLSELPAANLVLLSYLLCIKLKQNAKWQYFLLLGASLGAMVLIRYNLAIWVVLVGFFLLMQLIKKQLPVTQKIGAKQIGALLLSALPFLLIFLIINQNLYGGLLSSGYKLSGEETINLGLLWQRLPTYLVFLNLLYPFQLIVLFLAKTPMKKYIIAAYLISLFVYSTAGGFLFQGKLTDLITGIRFFIPLLPLGLFAYVSVFQKLTRKLKLIWKKLLLITITTGLLGTTLYINYSHLQFIQEKRINLQIIQQLMKKDVIFVVEEPDIIYFGPQLESNFSESGYLELTIFKKQLENGTLDSGKKYLFVDFLAKNMSETPSQAMIQLKKELIEQKDNIIDYEFLQI